jgi:GntR family transcriptional regulator
MGYLVAIQGKGRYVAERMDQIDILMSGDESFTSKMKEKGYELKTENIFCEKMEYDSYIFNELELDREQEVYKIGRLRILKDRPAAIHVSCVSKEIFESIDKEGSSILSMFSYYKSKGYESFYSEKSILSITFPTILEQNIFGCTGMIPLLKVETNCRDKNSGSILEYTKILYRGDYFKYIIK